MKRLGAVIGLKKECLEEYKRIHVKLWPEIEKAIKDAGIRNYSIYYNDGQLFGYFEYHGEFYDFPAIKLNPIPSHPVPILIGGMSDVAIRRTVQHGVGWTAGGAPPQMLAPFIQAMRDVLYAGEVPSPTVLAYIAVAALVALAGGRWVFARLDRDLAVLV